MELKEYWTMLLKKNKIKDDIYYNEQYLNRSLAFSTIAEFVLSNEVNITNEVLSMMNEDSKNRYIELSEQFLNHIYYKDTTVRELLKLVMRINALSEEAIYNNVVYV